MTAHESKVQMSNRGCTFVDVASFLLWSWATTLDSSTQISSNCQRLIQGQPAPSSDTSKQHLKRFSAFGHTWGHPLEHGTLDVTDRDTAAQPVDLSQLFSSELQPFGCSPTDVRRVCYHTLWVPVVRLCRFRRLECHTQTTAPDPSLSRLQNTNFWKKGTNCLGQLFHSFQPWSKQASTENTTRWSGPQKDLQKHSSGSTSPPQLYYISIFI